MAQGFMNDASYSLEEAKQAVNRGIYHRAVRRAQECVELSLKATLRLLGVEYPRQHEVGELLRKVSVERGLPEWFLSELPAIILVSKRLVENRGPAFYGDEAAFSPPRNLYAKEDAEKAVSDAEDVLKICRNLFDWWKGSELHG